METGMHEYEGEIAEVKKKLFSQIAASDKVLDVGIGTGPNLRFLQRGTQVVGVDPNQYMWPYAIEKAQSCGIELHMVGGIGERLPTEDNSYDFAIVTLTLCSVRDPSLTIREILRVLKPGGQLLFIEHVIADRSHPILRAAQILLNPLQQLFADGCHLNRDTGAILKNVGKPGFSEITYEEFNVQEFGSLIRSHIAGCARKASL